MGRMPGSVRRPNTSRMGPVPGQHIFVDETKAPRHYLMVAAVVLPQDLVSLRQAMRGLLLPGQRRTHFKSESDSRRRAIASTICATAVRVVIYNASAVRDQREARHACLEAIVTDAAECAAQLLVIERDDSLWEADRKLLYQQVRKAGCAETLRYQHPRAHEESLLWIPDAVAWCWAKGGDWRRRVEPVVHAEYRVGS